MAINESKQSNREKMNSISLSSKNKIQNDEKLNNSKLSKFSADRKVEFNNKIEFPGYNNNEEIVHVEKIENGGFDLINKPAEETISKKKDYDAKNIEKDNSNHLINHNVLKEDGQKVDDNNTINLISHNNHEKSLLDHSSEKKHSGSPYTPANDTENMVNRNKGDTQKQSLIELGEIKEDKNIISNDDKDNQQVMNKKSVLEKKKTLLARDLNDDEKINELQIFKKEVKEENKKEEETKKPPENTTKNFFKSLLDHFITTIIFTIFTIYALFADDVKMLTFDITYDQTFSIVIIILIFFFTVELVLSCLFQDKYFLGFFFFLDLLSLISMFLDIHWVYNALIDPTANTYPTQEQLDAFYNGTSTNVSKKASVSSSGKRSQAKGAASLARATRGARVGSRAVRILRILRLIRLVRISKLYKASQDLSKGGDVNIEVEIPEESKVGKKLTDLTTKRVIILVLSMMIAIMLFNPSFYYDPLSSMNFGIKIFNDFSSVLDPNLILAFNIYVDEHKNVSSPILFARVVNLTYGRDMYFLLRSNEKIEAFDDCLNLSPFDDPNSGCYSLFDNRPTSKLDSTLNIVKTIFICLVLSLGSLSFSKDTNDMVLEPIESMISKIKDISINPLEAMQKAERDEYFKSLLVEEESKSWYNCGKGDDKKEAPLETVILEKTITKIGALLALGFGEAGSEIIAKNMQDNAGGDVNPMIPGKKVMAIYGFCDIRNFTDSTEVLQENVMIFVNEIAEIVHDITSQYSGCANKNIGDAFLLVWKFDEQYVIKNDNGDLILKECESVTQIIDMSVIAFLKILLKIYRSYKLDKYRKNAGLNERIKNYSVKLGFGLHCGWSIEGAIGSTFKIDASYLSPHVNMASKLEEKTKDYGAQLILSGPLVKYMSQESRKYIRPIDCIKFNEGEDPIRIYTIDMDLSVLKIESPPTDGDKEIVDRFEKVGKRIKRKEFYKNVVVDRKLNAWENFIQTDEFFNETRKKFKPNFFDHYNNAFELYVTGDWEKAKEEFEEAESILGDKDGPSQCIIEFMKKDYNYKATDWHGFKSDAGH